MLRCRSAAPATLQFSLRECVADNYFIIIIIIIIIIILCSRYVSQGGDSALQENASRLKELEGRAQKTEEEKEAVSSEIDKLKEDIAKQQVS